MILSGFGHFLFFGDAMTVFTRIHLVVLDSLGVGEAPDAEAFGDAGANTFGHIAQACGGLHIPAMTRLGFANIIPLTDTPPSPNPIGFFGKMRERSSAKDTMTGHWELMGLVTNKSFRVYPDGFPPELVAEIERQTGRRVIGNIPASGTDIIRRLGPEHMATGALIVYTSADSVLQIAAHEEVVPLEELYDICALCRKLTLGEPYTLGRIIARPFVGAPGSFKRTANRHDYAAKPDGRTTLDALKDAGLTVAALGKINDIFDGEGITRSVKTRSNSDGMEKLLALLGEDFRGLSFLNLVDFDMEYGHRRDALAYGKAIETFDRELHPIMAALKPQDLLLLTADHGTDPIHPGTDHTREYVPIVAWSPCMTSGRSLGVRETFADVAATIAENFAVTPPAHGKSFFREINSGAN